MVFVLLFAATTSRTAAGHTGGLGIVVAGAAVVVVAGETSAAVADVAELGPALLAASVTAPALSCATSVPAPVQVTVTVTDVPEVAEGVKVHPVAVPAFEKLDDDSPEMDSLKVNV